MCFAPAVHSADQAAPTAEEREARAKNREARREEFTEHYHALLKEISGTAGDLHGRLLERRPAALGLRDEFLADAAAGRIGNVGGILNSFGHLFSHDATLEAEFHTALRGNPNGEIKDYLARNQTVLGQMRARSAELTLPALDGGAPLDLKAWRGKPVLVNIWSLHCGGCIEAMPKLQAIYERYKGQFEILGVCLLFNEEEREKDLRVLKEKGVTWRSGTIVMDKRESDDAPPGEFELKLAPFGPPQRFSGLYFVLDQQGRLISTEISAQWLEFEVRKMLGLPLLKAGDEAWRPAAR
jgi:thiol-disulfide isomerase/thioredoxin